MPHITRVDLQRPEHGAALLELLDGYACDPMGGGAPLAAHVRARLLTELAAFSGYVGFLAQDPRNGQAIGLINCFTGFSTFAARPLLNVHDLFVQPAWRGQGIAHALLAAAEAHARQQGCCKLTLEVLGNNHAARASYLRFGFLPYELDPAAGQAQLMQKWLLEPAV